MPASMYRIFQDTLNNYHIFPSQSVTATSSGTEGYTAVKNPSDGLFTFSYQEAQAFYEANQNNTYVYDFGGTAQRSLNG